LSTVIFYISKCLFYVCNCFHLQIKQKCPLAYTAAAKFDDPNYVHRFIHCACVILEVTVIKNKQQVSNNTLLILLIFEFCIKHQNFTTEILLNKKYYFCVLCIMFNKIWTFRYHDQVLWLSLALKIINELNLETFAMFVKSIFAFLFSCFFVFNLSSAV
jgi:hypothetical protein